MITSSNLSMTNKELVLAAMVQLYKLDYWQVEADSVRERYGEDAEPEYAESLRDDAWKELRRLLRELQEQV